MTRAALLAIAEGTASLAGQDSVRRLMFAVAAKLPDVDVRLGYVDVQEPGIAAALRESPAGSRVVVVPLVLLPEHPMHVDLAAAAGAHPEVHITGALGPDPRIARVLAGRLREQRAEAFGPDAADAVVLAIAGLGDVGSGPRQAELLAQELGHSVRVGYLTAAEPRIADIVSAARSRPRLDGEPRRVVIASGALTSGFLHDLAIRSGADLVTRPLLDADDPAPELVDLVVDRYLDALDGPVSATL
jgi:sirohydrochlorin ferrochelatase